MKCEPCKFRETSCQTARGVQAERRALGAQHNASSQELPLAAGHTSPIKTSPIKIRAQRGGEGWSG